MYDIHVPHGHTCRVHTCIHYMLICTRTCKCAWECAWECIVCSSVIGRVLHTHWTHVHVLCITTEAMYVNTWYIINACMKLHTFLFNVSTVHCTIRRTMPKQISRRATGVPGRMKMPSFYEQTDPDLNEKPRQPAKRSVSNVSAFQNPPSQPPPRLNSNQTSPSTKRRLSAEPEVPHISEGSNENLTVPFQNEERRSQESSRQSSVNRLSGLSEDLDEDLSNYEPIDGYLKEKRRSENKVPLPQQSESKVPSPQQSENKVPSPQRSQEGSPRSHRSSMAEAPHYPAPLPPGLNKLTPDNDEDSDGYEQVQLASQDDNTNEFRDEVERAVLPLKPGVVRVGSGLPQPHSRERSPSYTGAPSFMKRHGRERSPTVALNRQPSGSPPSIGVLSSSVPASSILSSGASPSHLLRPPIKDKSSSPPKWADTKSGKVLIPPEPASPPPSPPIGRDVFSPPGKPTSQQRHRSSSPPTEQPVLPPKKKSVKNPSYESHILQAHSKPTNDDNEIYSFDRLSPPPAAAPRMSSPAGTPQRDAVTTTSVGTTQQDDIYFDHLTSGPPPLPKKASTPAYQTGSTRQTSQPGSQPDDDNVYFDHLASGPPPTVPSKTGQTSNNIEEPVKEDVYFDHLVTGPPSVPSKTGQTSLPETQFDDDQVYFDHLVPNRPVKPVQPPPGPMLPPKRQTSSESRPNQPQSEEAPRDDVYFDHLFTADQQQQQAPPTLPAKPGAKRPVSTT